LSLDDSFTAGRVGENFTAYKAWDICGRFLEHNLFVLAFIAADFDEFACSFWDDSCHTGRNS
jgi:hypothetical protein